MHIYIKIDTKQLVTLVKYNCILKNYGVFQTIFLTIAYHDIV